VLVHSETMNNARNATRLNTGTTAGTAQLTLLPDLAPAPNVSTRFLLSQDTRELGMRQVAEIRQILAERKAARDAASVVTVALPARTHRAA
jgi:hypothetical protein